MTRFLPSAVLLALTAACAPALTVVGDERVPLEESASWDLPPGLPPPSIPDQHRLTAEKIELGRHLFYDRRLSWNRKQSCASCHRQTLAFSDGRSTAVGSTGEIHRRNTPSLTNVAYRAVFTWADPGITSLEEQVFVPLLGRHPVEMGIGGHETEILARLRADSRYRSLFDAAFPGQEHPIRLETVAEAIASFERTLVSFDSAYDRYALRGESQALSPEAKRGMALFFSTATGCARCHGGLNFAGAARGVAGRSAAPEFHNTGLVDIDAASPRPHDPGLRAVTGEVGDEGKFRTPTLRNVALTAPYMHDGSVATLEEVIDRYAAGIRTTTNSPKSDAVRGLSLRPQEKRDLLAFLHSLTDRSFVRDPRFSDPWILWGKRHLF